MQSDNWHWLPLISAKFSSKYGVLSAKMRASIISPFSFPMSWYKNKSSDLWIEPLFWRILRVSALGLSQCQKDIDFTVWLTVSSLLKELDFWSSILDFVVEYWHPEATIAELPLTIMAKKVPIKAVSWSNLQPWYFGLSPETSWILKRKKFLHHWNNYSLLS